MGSKDTGCAYHKQYEHDFIWVSVASPDARVEIWVTCANMPCPGFKPLSHPCNMNLLLAPHQPPPPCTSSCWFVSSSQTRRPLHTCKHEGPQTSALKFCLRSSSLECCETKLYWKLPAHVLLCKRDCFISQAAVITKPLRSHQAGRWDECISVTRRDTCSALNRVCQFVESLLFCMIGSCKSQVGTRTCEFAENACFLTVGTYCFPRTQVHPFPLGLWCLNPLP